MATKKKDTKTETPAPGFGAAWVNDAPEETSIASPTAGDTTQTGAVAHGTTEEKTDG